MASKSVTLPLQPEVGFHKSPALPDGLLAVRSGVDPFHARSLADIILCWLRDRNEQLVHVDALEDEPFIHGLMLDMALSLYTAGGSRA